MNYIFKCYYYKFSYINGNREALYLLIAIFWLTKFARNIAMRAIQHGDAVTHRRGKQTNALHILTFDCKRNRQRCNYRTRLARLLLSVAYFKNVCYALFKKKKNDLDI